MGLLLGHCMKQHGCSSASMVWRQIANTHQMVLRMLVASTFMKARHVMMQNKLEVISLIVLFQMILGHHKFTAPGMVLPVAFFPTKIGTDDIAGRALVVHDKTGARIACGLIPASVVVV